MGAIQLFDGYIEKEISKPNCVNFDTMNINNIPNNFVISRNLNGEVLSVYADDIWDLKPYRSNPSQHTKIDFLKRIKKSSLINESKKLIFLIFSFGSGRNGSKYSVETIMHFFNNAIYPLSEYAKYNKKSIHTILENEDVLNDFVIKKCDNKNKTQVFLSFLAILNKIDNNLSCIKYNKNKKILDLLLIKLKKTQQTQQTNIIPSRILKESIKIRWEQIEEIEKNIDGILKFLNMFLQDEQFAISDKTFKEQFSKMNNQAVPWTEAIQIHHLSELLDKYEIKNRKMFQGFITSIYGTSKHLIHMYTGMRSGEVLMLRNQCIKAEDTKSGVCHIISTTSKLEGRNKLSRWTTTKELIKVINLLGEINKVIAYHYSISIENMPLFIKSSLITSLKNKAFDISQLEKRKFGLRDEFPIPQNTLMINVFDVKEFDEINYANNNSQIKIGETWIFKSHQYRRSLAVYAIQSGLVSLGALQIQFKHLFREMTLYYANGASYAKKLFDVPKDHIANDFDKLKPEIETLEYIKNVIFSDEQLFGTHGTFIERNIKNKEVSQKSYILENREKTLKQFKNGEITYKETALGGCVSTEACDYSLTHSIVACGGCDSSIIKKSKLDNVINRQKEFIGFLDKDSIEYRTEMRDLEELEKQRKQFLGSKA